MCHASDTALRFRAKILEELRFKFYQVRFVIESCVVLQIRRHNAGIHRCLFAYLPIATLSCNSQTAEAPNFPKYTKSAILLLALHTPRNYPPWVCTLEHRRNYDNNLGAPAFLVSTLSCLILFL
jgi:hypothetical protein